MRLLTRIWREGSIQTLAMFAALMAAGIYGGTPGLMLALVLLVAVTR